MVKDCEEAGDAGGEAASLREAPLPQNPSPEERLAFGGRGFCWLGSACEMGASPVGWVVVTGNGTPPPALRAPPISGEAFGVAAPPLKGFTRKARTSPAASSLSYAQALVENGTFSTGPFVRNRREPRPRRPCEAPPTQVACQRGVRGPARRMESSPAPGSLWFLSPAGKELVRPLTHETPSSHTLNPACVPPLLIPLPSLVLLPNSSLPLSLRPKTTKK